MNWNILQRELFSEKSEIFPLFRFFRKFRKFIYSGLQLCQVSAKSKKLFFFIHSFIIMTTRCARGCAGQGCTGRYYTARARLRRVVHYAFLVNKTIRLKHSTCKTSVGVKQDSNVWWKIFHFGTNLYGYITCFSSAKK